MSFHSLVMTLSTLAFSTWAHAATYTCDGHELLGAEPNAVGQVTIDIDAFTANWQPQDGTTASVLSPSEVCGFATAGSNCHMSSMAQSETPGNELVCIDSNWNVVATADIVMSQVSWTGRVECRAGSTRTTLELSNCH